MKKNSLSFYISISLGVHLLALIFFLFSQSHWSFFDKKKKVLQTAVRVDMIGLPELEKKQKKENKTFKQKNVKKKKVKKIKKKKSVDIKKKSNSKKKKDKKKKEKQKEENKTSNQKNIEKENTKNKNVKKGNKISKGIEGGVSQEQQSAMINIYLTQIIGAIKLNWKLPKYLVNKNYYAQLEIQIDKRGKVVSKKLESSSNNELFDSLALKAIEASQPFPTPPKEIQRLISDGIVFGLSSND